MKKKPHQRQSVINKLFSDFRKSLHKPGNPSDTNHYEVKKTKNGYSVTIHTERGANQSLHFENKKQLDEYLKGL